MPLQTIRKDGECTGLTKSKGIDYWWSAFYGVSAVLLRIYGKFYYQRVRNIAANRLVCMICKNDLWFLRPDRNSILTQPEWGSVSESYHRHWLSGQEAAAN